MVGTLPGGRQWLFSGLFLAAGIGGRIWAEKRHPGMTAERQSKQSFRHAEIWDKVLAPLMAVSIVFPMVIVAGLGPSPYWSPEFSIEFCVLGFAAIAFGYAFAAWALAGKPIFL